MTTRIDKEIISELRKTIRELEDKIEQYKQQKKEADKRK